MPFVDLSTVESSEQLWLGLEMESDWDAVFGIGAIVTLGINLTATLSNDIVFEIPDFELGPDIDMFSVLRIDDEQNINLEAVADFGVDIESTTFLTSILDFQGIFDMGLEMPDVNAVWSQAELSELVLTVNVRRVVAFPSNHHEYKVLFKIDGVEVPIKKATIIAAKNKVGTDLSVTLSDVADRELLTEGAVYTLDIGFAVGVSTEWVTLSTGLAVNQAYDVGWADNAPTDEIVLSTGSQLSYLLNTSPYYPIVFFDPEFIDVTEANTVPFYDIGGNPYPSVILRVPGLSLHLILSYCFSQIGIDWTTNIPNYRVKRLDIGLGQTYFQASGGLYGVFDPLYIESDGTLHILDSTLIQPSGFEPTKTITASKYKSIKMNRPYSDINGYVLEYNQSTDAWDEFTDEDIVSENVINDFDEGKLTRVLITTTERNYYRRSTPTVTVRKETIRILTITTVYDPVLYGEIEITINSSREDFVYDHVGKILRHGKHEYARIPLWNAAPSGVEGGEDDGYWEYSFELVRTEYEEYTYKDSPYKSGTEYRESLYQVSRALVYIDPELMYETIDVGNVGFDIDPDKEVPVDYKQLYVDAYRGGNLSEEGERAFETVRARHEFTVPVSKDAARVETKEVDHLSKVVTINVTEEQIGEFATSSQVGQSRKAVVYANGGSRSNRRMGTLNIGEIPLGYGIPLAIRKLERELNGAEMQIENIGIDDTVVRGTIMSVIGRNNEELGNFLTEGWQITLDKLGTPEQIVMSTYDVIKI